MAPLGIPALDDIRIPVPQPAVAKSVALYADAFLAENECLVTALFIFTDDAKLGEVAQLRVDEEFAELVVRLDEEVRRMCTSCDPIRIIVYEHVAQTTPGK